MRRCQTCGVFKDESDFYKVGPGRHLSRHCKPCYKGQQTKALYAKPERLLSNRVAVNARRFPLKAQVSWANQFIIREAHRLAVLRTKVTGIKWTIDHIVPLKSLLVCGLHTHDNICVIPLAQNCSKGNRSWPDMP